MDHFTKRLISDAARAVELFGEDELERYAEEAKKGGKGGGMAGRLYNVPFLCGDGSKEVILRVRYIAHIPIGEDGLCAFCHGDPCNEVSGEDSLIGQYFKRNRRAETCPCCNGRAS